MIIIDCLTRADSISQNFNRTSALWKFNSGFMAPSTSCAPIYLVQLADQYIPRSLLLQAPFLVTLLVNSAPLMVLIVEAAAPALLWVSPKAGIVFTSLFHFLIAITVRSESRTEQHNIVYIYI